MGVKNFGERKCGKLVAVLENPDVGGGDEEATEGGGGLGPAEDAFFATGFGEEFGEPSDGGDKFDADADESGATEENEGVEAGRKGGGDGGKSVEKNARRHHAFAAEAIDQPASEEAESATAEGGNPEQSTDPVGYEWAAEGEVEEFGDCGDADEGGHEEFVGIKEKPDGGDGDDQPLGEGESGGGGGGS